ncbi:hypothetical protein Sjap_017394 [Stephania japonica]|uniref:Reverse transcriptase Ty1/copia-type domain-containing protein n=1 Tax=Stephania japonica TaxID=461633 RepID=A0AAP0I633_9MAGN
MKLACNDNAFCNVCNKWVFTNKRNSDGTVNRYKAHLVSKGFKQVRGVDFSETYSSVVKASTLRIIFSIAVTFGWNIRQIDINNVFLNGKLDEEVYTNQPEGFIEYGTAGMVCRLHKALYGLHQAPRAWFHELKNQLLNWGFRNAISDSSLFTLQQGSLFYVLVYVDDIIITGTSSQLIQTFIDRLNKRFALKDIDDLKMFLGFEVHRDSSGLYLNQTSYISTLL